MYNNLDNYIAFNKAIEDMEELLELQDLGSIPFDDNTQKRFHEARKIFEMASAYALRISRLLKKEDYETTFHTLLNNDLREIDELFNDQK